MKTQILVLVGTLMIYTLLYSPQSNASGRIAFSAKLRLTGGTTLYDGLSYRVGNRIYKISSAPAYFGYDNHVPDTICRLLGHQGAVMSNSQRTDTLSEYQPGQHQRIIAFAVGDNQLITVLSTMHEHRFYITDITCRNQ